MVSNPFDYLVAKETGGKWLSLLAHQLDTAGIIKYLLENYVSESFLEFSGLDKNVIRKLAVFLALTHDMGKFTAFFQFRITAGNTMLRNRVENEIYGFKLAFENDSINHSLYSELILLLCGCPSCIAEILGAHHGKPADDGDVNNYGLNIDRWIDINNNTKVYGKKNNMEPIGRAWKHYIEWALCYAGFGSLDNLPRKIRASAGMLLSGLLIMADWIASNTVFFPLVASEESIDFTDYPKRVETALSKLRLTERWSPANRDYTYRDFEQAFGFSPNDVQRQMLKTIASSQKPGIYILEAPMGIGKTEAALAACSLIAGKEGKSGLFFGMPTQATANGIFPRIEQWGKAQSSDSLHSIILKHGASDLNEDFARLCKSIPDSYTEQGGLTVHSWFLSSKKSSLASFMVSTVDRLLMMALKRKHVMLLHLGLSEKVAIIDECHAYDAYMNSYLYRALEWLGAYHTPVILLSATLDAAKRMELISAYSGMDIASMDKSMISDTAYPLLTYYDGEVKTLPMTYSGAHRVVKCTLGEDSNVISLIGNALSRGACIGIIVNTVRRAQMFYDEIADFNPILYHARYTSSDRAAKEKQMLSLVGKKSTPEVRRGVCVIGTQVLEQSLDIDFDLLVTDIAPMDLLLQRIGRLHRHQRLRPEQFENAQCIVLTDEITREGKTGSKIIYTPWLLNKTLNSLPEEILLPDDISPLVQKVYSAVEESSEEYKEYVWKIAKMKSEAQKFLLPKPDRRSLHNLLDHDVNDSDGNVAVRLGDTTVEVILLKQNADGAVMLLDGTPIADKPSEKDYMVIANQTIRLPNAIAANRKTDDVIKALDNNNKSVSVLSKSYLTADTPVLLLDDNNRGELLGYELEYSYEYGLKHKKKE